MQKESENSYYVSKVITYNYNSVISFIDRPVHSEIIFNPIPLLLKLRAVSILANFSPSIFPLVTPSASPSVLHLASPLASPFARPSARPSALPFASPFASPFARFSFAAFSTACSTA